MCATLIVKNITIVDFLMNNYMFRQALQCDDRGQLLLRSLPDQPGGTRSPANGDPKVMLVGAVEEVAMPIGTWRMP